MMFTETRWTGRPRRNTRWTSSCAGETTTRMMWSATLAPSSSTTRRTTWASTRPRPAPSSPSTSPTTCTVPSVTGSRAPSRSSSRRWQRSWRRIPLCTCCGSGSGRNCSCTPQNPPSPTCPHRTTGNSSPTRSSGSSTTPTSTVTIHKVRTMSEGNLETFCSYGSFALPETDSGTKISLCRWASNIFHYSPRVASYILAKIKRTRMHSSRMRTGRSWTVCQSPLPGGVLHLRGVLHLGGFLHPGGSSIRGVPPSRWVGRGLLARAPPSREQNDRQV